MSHRLIARSNDLLALRDAGLHLEIRNGYLLIKDVPYVTASRNVRENGVLVSKLETEIVGGHERTKKPTDHVAYWIGEHPCHANGEKIRSFENPSNPQDFGNGVKVDFTFSAKADYRDYQQKMQAYLGWIVGEAKKLRPEVRAETHPVYATDEDDDDVFHYIDTASCRVHIGADNEKLESQRIAIVGVGGTGSYACWILSPKRAWRRSEFLTVTASTPTIVSGPRVRGLSPNSNRKNQKYRHFLMSTVSCGDEGS